MGRLNPLLVEFAHKKLHRESLGMSPFEALYGKGCKTLVNWDSLVNRLVLGLGILKEMEHEIIKIEQNLKVTQDMKKSYADLKGVHEEFKIGDHVYLRVKPRKISLKLASCAKMEPRYHGPFEVLNRIGPVAYRIAFPANMRTHNVFHVFFLKKYVMIIIT